MAENTTTNTAPTTISDNETTTLPELEQAARWDFESWVNTENVVTFGLSFFLFIGTIVWICIWYKRKRSGSSKKKPKDNEKDRSSTTKSSPSKGERKDDLPQLPKTPSIVSIQSTGSNYYDQLMGSGNIPKVKSISQYGALLAQQEPPPP